MWSCVSATDDCSLTGKCCSCTSLRLLTLACPMQPTTSADSLQTIDEATLQEFRQKAAMEEATRVPEIQEPESEPQRFNFHR